MMPFNNIKAYNEKGFLHVVYATRGVYCMYFGLLFDVIQSVSFLAKQTKDCFIRSFIPFSTTKFVQQHHYFLTQPTRFHTRLSNGCMWQKMALVVCNHGRLQYLDNGAVKTHNLSLLIDLNELKLGIHTVLSWMQTPQEDSLPGY